MKNWLASALLVAWASPALAQSTPYHATPAAIPGTIEAEDYDNGGQGVAYFDTTSGNQLGQYRQDDVDIETSSEHGFNVGKIRLTEWLNYSVNVLAAGTYELDARVSCLGAGGTFHIEFNGVNATGTMTIPDTGAWQTWTTISTTVTLAAGTQFMKVVVEGLGASSAVGNLNYFTLTMPFHGTPATVPGTIEAEDYDNGGQGVAYSDTTAGNQLGQYRQDDVDIETSSEHGFNVGKIRLTEWLTYSVNVVSAGTYQLDARVSCLGAGGTFHIEFNGVNATGTMTVPDTGAWQTWTTISTTVTLAAGPQIMKVVVDGLGGTTALGNLNYFTLTAGSSTQITVVQWNVHKFREECPEPPNHHWDCQNSIEEIADYLVNNQADIVSFNEVNNQRNPYELNQVLEDQPAGIVDALERKTQQCWESLYIAADGSASTGTVGNLLLWRSKEKSCPQPGQGTAGFQKQSAPERHQLPFAPDGYRSAGAVTLLIGPSSRPVTFFTTHLCAPPESTCTHDQRLVQLNDPAAGLRPWAAGKVTPHIMSGDFNANPSDPEISGSTGMNTAYSDQWPVAVNAGTATGTTTPANTSQITETKGTWRPDYVFVPNNTTVVTLVRMKIEDIRGVAPNHYQISDHFPSVAVFTVR